MKIVQGTAAAPGVPVASSVIAVAQVTSRARDRVGVRVRAGDETSCATAAFFARSRGTAMAFCELSNYSSGTHLSNSGGAGSRRASGNNVSGNDVTQLLKRWRNGSRDAESELMERVQGELRRLAAGYLRHERAGRTLQPTAVVNEAYIRLLPQRGVSWANRAHFFGIAAKMMRRVLVDRARRK